MMESAEREDLIRRYVDSLVGPDRLIEVRIYEAELREAVKLELEARGCQVTPGPEPEVLVIVCPEAVP